MRPEPAAWGVPGMTAVTLHTEDGLALLAWWKPPHAPDRPVIVFFHGNAGHIGYRGAKLRMFLDRGYGVLLPAWRGYSGNPGTPHEAGFYADGRAALRFLDQQNVPNRRRVFYGESLGGAVAVELAAAGAGGAMVLEAPFTSLPEVAAAHYPIFPARQLVRDRFDSEAKIGRVRIPLLVVHGERDRVVPVRFGRALLAAANEPRDGAFIANAGHNDLYMYGAAGRVTGFIDRLYDSGAFR